MPQERQESWLLREQTVTGYEGFVRMGARRGFHLLLVLEKNGGFEPMLT